MPSVRFVEGTADDYSTVYDCDWPVVPRVGEFLSITVGTGQVIDWEVTRICHVASGDEELIGTLAWIKEQPRASEYSDEQRAADTAKIDAFNRGQAKRVV